MSGFFYELGRRMGPRLRKGVWLWRTLTGSESEVIQAEYEAGEDLAQEVRAQLETDPDRAIPPILIEVGSRLTASLINKKRHFQFETSGLAEPNALALPGGFIFVTDSLLEICDHDRDEIAFILGHEMAHVVRGHAIDRIVASSAMRLLSRSPTPAGILSGWIRKVGIRFLEQAYSRDQELEADGFAVRLAASAGYDPTAATRLLTRLEERTEDLPPLGEYFTSHPPLRDRIGKMGKMGGQAP